MLAGIRTAVNSKFTGMQLIEITLQCKVSNNYRPRDIVIPLFRSSYIFYVLVGSSLAYWGFVFATQLFFVDKQLFVVLHDEAMMSMRFAKNWADGFGIFWNKGGSPEGYTNFLLVAIMALFHNFSTSYATMSIFIITLNWFFQIILIIIVYNVSEKYFETVESALFSSIFSGFSLQLLYWGSGGFETTLLCCFAAIAIFFILNDKLLFASLSLSLGVLARDDFTLLVFSLGITLPFLCAENWRMTWIYFSKLVWLPLFSFLGHLSWRLYYYGEALPNTYYLKATGWDYVVKIQEGAHYVLGSAPIITASLIGYYWIFRSVSDIKRKGLSVSLMLSIVLYTCYIINVGGDSFGGARLFSPMFIVFSFAGGFLVEKLRGKLVIAILIVGIFVFYPTDREGLHQATSWFRPILQLTGIRNYGMSGYPVRYSSTIEIDKHPANVRNVQNCKLMREHATENRIRNPSVAVYYAGVTPYLCHEFRAIDLLGKSDEHIARMKVKFGRVGHNKFDYDYSLSVHAPIYFISLMPSVASLTDRQYLNKKIGNFNWHLLPRSSEFMDNYSKYALRPDHFPIFVRSDTR